MSKINFVVKSAFAMSLVLGAGFASAQTPAANVQSGTFGANVGGGTYVFSSRVLFAVTTPILVPVHLAAPSDPLPDVALSPGLDTHPAPLAVPAPTGTVPGRTASSSVLAVSRSPRRFGNCGSSATSSRHTSSAVAA